MLANKHLLWAKLLLTNNLALQLNLSEIEEKNLSGGIVRGRKLEASKQASKQTNSKPICGCFLCLTRADYYFIYCTLDSENENENEIEIERAQ